MDFRWYQDRGRGKVRGSKSCNICLNDVAYTVHTHGPLLSKEADLITWIQMEQRQKYLYSRLGNNMPCLKVYIMK